MVLAWGSQTLSLGSIKDKVDILNLANDLNEVRSLSTHALHHVSLNFRVKDTDLVNWKN